MRSLSSVLISLALLISVICAPGQGTFIFDQQSSTDESAPPFGTGSSLQAVSPGAGQSFTPTLSSVDFVRLLFDDGNTFDGLGATIFVALRSGSITGTILGTATPIAMPNGFAGATTFIFSSPISISSGVPYYIEPIVQSGGSWNIIAGPYNYSGGTAFANGNALGGSDLWFREGVIVPEPSAPALIIAGVGIAFCVRRRPGRYQQADEHYCPK